MFQATAIISSTLLLHLATAYGPPSWANGPPLSGWNPYSGTYGALTPDWPPAITGQPLAPQSPDAELQAMIAQIDPQRIQYIVANLTNFGTRHTLSSQTDPVRGIGAARDWIAAQMRAIAAPFNGRMTVDVPYYIQPASVASRILFDVKISNVVARINGTGDPNRVYVITGHYDSRALNISDYTGDAPGSDDNASGVAGRLTLLVHSVTLIRGSSHGACQDMRNKTTLRHHDLRRDGGRGAGPSWQQLLGIDAQEPIHARRGQLQQRHCQHRLQCAL